jgi:hypothetical protein
MANGISTEINKEALLALKRSTAKRLREERALDTAPNRIQLILDHALYLPVENGIVAVVALVNPTEQPEQVIGVTIEIASPDGDRFEFPATSIPSTLPAPEIPVWYSAFPVRIAAVEALIGQMFFMADDERSMIECAQAIASNGPLKAAVHFMTLKSGTITCKCKVANVQHYRSMR